MHSENFSYAEQFTQAYLTLNYGSVSSSIQGPLTIAQPLTIDVTGVTDPCPFPIIVNPGAGNTVVLRGFRFNNFSNANPPITVASGIVKVEDLRVSGVPGGGGGASGSAILVQGGQLLLEDAIIHNVAYGVNLAVGSNTLNNVRIQGASQAALIVYNSGFNGVTNATVRKSFLSNNGTGLLAEGGSNVHCEDSTITYNNTGISVFSQGTARISNTTVADNTGFGLGVTSGGSLISFVNNRIYNNGVNGTPTASVYQK